MLHSCVAGWIIAQAAFILALFGRKSWAGAWRRPSVQESRAGRTLHPCQRDLHHLTRHDEEDSTKGWHGRNLLGTAPDHPGWP